MKTELYPLKFRPILKEKIWGGEKLQSLLHKEALSSHTGESWEISAIEGNVSKVKNGPLAGKSLIQVLAEYRECFVGRNVFKKFGEKFPLLFKFIDAKADLSLQLHPNDELAKKRHNSFGKTEMWYVVQADENAGIYVGFKKGTTRNDYLKHLEEGSLEAIMNFETVQPGDVFFIKPGLVHAIGKGVMLAEIQQTSDITYRVFDWNRMDITGKPRELHTDLALDAIDFTPQDFRVTYKPQKNAWQILVENAHFTTRTAHLTRKTVMNFANIDSFVVLMCVQGMVEIKSERNMKNEFLQTGQTLMLPACLEKIELLTKNAKLLEITI